MDKQIARIQAEAADRQTELVAMMEKGSRLLAEITQKMQQKDQGAIPLLTAKLSFQISSYQKMRGQMEDDLRSLANAETGKEIEAQSLLATQVMLRQMILQTDAECDRLLQVQEDIKIAKRAVVAGDKSEDMMQLDKLKKALEESRKINGGSEK